MNIAQVVLSRGVESSPAVYYKDRTLTYGQLRTEVKRMADVVRDGAGAPGGSGRTVGSGESSLGAELQIGERIGIFSENSPFFISAYLGVMQAGKIAVPFQTEIGRDCFDQTVADAGIQRMFVSGRLERKVRPWAEALGIEIIREAIEREIEHGSWESNDDSKSEKLTPGARVTPIGAHRESLEMGPSEVQTEPSAEEGQKASRTLAALMFTSGSTGQPKGVMVTHRNIECNTRDIISYMDLTAADRCMVVLPFHYCFGLSLLHTHLMVGGSLVLNNEFRLYPETVLREMQEKECTGFAGVPSTYQILLRKSRFRQMTFPKLRWFQQAGGKLPNPCIAEILESFPEVKYFLMYGQTEATARLSYLPPERLKDKFGSIGKGLPSTKLEVLKRDGTSVVLGSTPERREEQLINANQRLSEPPMNTEEHGAAASASGTPSFIPHPSSLPSAAPSSLSDVGEIVASGASISPGYWNDPVETAKYFRNGKLYTGDLARVDEDGFLFIVERERDMIKSGGNRVSAKEVEDVVAELTEVLQVAAVGAPHDVLGECIKIFVVLVPHAKLKVEGIHAHCRKRLPAYKCPEQVLILPALPQNSAGKVLKKVLKAKSATDTL